MLKKLAKHKERIVTEKLFQCEGHAKDCTETCLKEADVTASEMRMR